MKKQNKTKNTRSTSSTISQKLARLEKNKPPRVLDLFAGCGGISLGFHSAGFEIAGALEIDAAAAKSHAMNFHKNTSPEIFEKHSQPRDIITTNPEELLRDFGLIGPPEMQVDVIVGGPPCQSFARVGRAKLREIAEHPEAFLHDNRSNLYLRYLEYVKELKPLALLVENVPDILNYGGHNIAEEMCEVLGDLGYECRYTLLNAVFFGVPEMRERMFLVAFRKEVAAERWLPSPTHWTKLPAGYYGSRQVALQTIHNGLFDRSLHFQSPPEPSYKNSKRAITAKQALSDLPIIDDDSEFKKSKAPRRFNSLSSYSQKPKNEYQRLMRSWPSFGNKEGIYDHVIRYLPRDYKIFARMQPGDQYPEAHSLALRMFEERMTEIEREEGRKPKRGTKRFESERSNYVPPYDPKKFPNKWRKMEADAPARTLMAHLGKDSYSHIHYDSNQARTISVREAARLQSFPDGFVFNGPMNPAFRQIGNAVPPLMAQAVANVIFKQLNKVQKNDTKDCVKTAVVV